MKRLLNNPKEALSGREIRQTHIQIRQPSRPHSPQEVGSHQEPSPFPSTATEQFGFDLGEDFVNTSMPTETGNLDQIDLNNNHFYEMFNPQSYIVPPASGSTCLRPEFLEQTDMSLQHPPASASFTHSSYKPPSVFRGTVHHPTFPPQQLDHNFQQLPHDYASFSVPDLLFSSSDTTASSPQSISSSTTNPHTREISSLSPPAVRSGPEQNHVEGNMFRVTGSTGGEPSSVYSDMDPIARQREQLLKMTSMGFSAMMQ